MLQLGVYSAPRCRWSSGSCNGHDGHTESEYHVFLFGSDDLMERSCYVRMYIKYVDDSGRKHTSRSYDVFLCYNGTRTAVDDPKRSD